MPPTKKRVKIVVLGDIGRSPRMQYHSLSMAEMGHQVDIVGYGETSPMEAIKTHPLISLHYLSPVPKISGRLRNYAFKTVFQAINLLFVLLFSRRSSQILVQNPPAIPSLFVCWLYAKLVWADLVIDWHNYAYTIMGLSVGEDHPLVRVTKKVEAFMGRRANYNFCVTKAMQDDLQKNWKVSATILYDKPPGIFKTISLEEKHVFFKNFSEKYSSVFDGDTEHDSAFTSVSNSVTSLKANRPGLLVSSTSWTDDEDFSVLLSALQDYEEHCQNGNVRKLSKLICVITGKGPLKEYYCKEIASKDWKSVTVLTPWLEIEDYPTLLASADLGVSLHTSSSGLDLPMKVVDMFGCGLPVCAYDFKCLGELVCHGENGYRFQTPEQLAQLICSWFEDFPNNARTKATEEKMKSNLRSFQQIRWKENWAMIASPIFCRRVI